MRKPYTLLLSIIAFATLTRASLPPLLGHAPNFSALDALALFCGAYCHQRWHAVAIVLLSVWTGDILLTHNLFYEGCYWQYASYALIALLGRNIFYSQSITLTRYARDVTLMTFSSSILFFVISNFGVWFSGAMYPHTTDGLITCYISAIPFFKSTVISDFVFSGVLFNAMAFLNDAPDTKNVSEPQKL